MTTTVPRTSLWPALVGALRGTVLELGPGDGGNLRYYAPDVRLIAIEPSALTCTASTCPARSAPGSRTSPAPRSAGVI